MRAGPDPANLRPDSGGPSPGASRRSARWAWLAVGVWIALVLWLGSGAFGAPNTSRILLPVLRWLLPDWSAQEIWDLALWIRKVAHPTVYGVLALLSLNAWRLSWPGPAWRCGLGAWGLAVVVACVDESRQLVAAGRTGSAWDVGLDASGAAGAVVAALLAAALVSRAATARMPRGEEEPG